MKVYACKNKNDETRLNSSSGGIFTLLAEEIIKEGGNVIGAAWEGLDVKHISIDSIEELPRLQGSKYVESQLDYSAIGDHTLFSGTPCQITPKAYLKVEVVCHGTPTKESFKEYCKENGVEWINFRNKENGWLAYLTETNNGKEGFYSNSFMRDFIHNRNLTPKCFNCQFKDRSNADITLGDFWGVQVLHKEFFDDKGVSVVIVRTDRGQEYFNKIKDKIDYIESTFEKAVMYNPSINKVVKK